MIDRTPEAIVRSLASSSPTAASEIHGDPFCTLCNVDLDLSAEHDADCPWRQAVEWIAEHPDT